MGIGSCAGKCKRLNIPKLPKVKMGTKYEFYNYCSTCSRWWNKLQFDNPKQCLCCNNRLRFEARFGQRRSKLCGTPRM
jgi:hypothetical protein